MTSANGRPAQAPTEPPALLRRLACLVYEGVLLFGVLMISGYLYSSLTQQRHALQGRAGLQAFLFVILGIYFAWFWSRSGQTLAMKTWHLRVVRTDGAALTQARALARYIASWLWFLPALAISHLAGLQSSGQIFAVLTLGVLAYASVARLRSDGRLLHDLVCDTVVISTQPASAKVPAKSNP